MSNALLLITMLAELGLRMSKLTLEVQAVIEKANSEGRDISDEEIEALRAGNQDLHAQAIAKLTGSSPA